MNAKRQVLQITKPIKLAQNEKGIYVILSILQITQKPMRFRQHQPLAIGVRVIHAGMKWPMIIVT